MSAQYWIARYVPNPFRNEPRNVGVIVAKDGLVAGVFLGERDNGTLDERKTRAFGHPNVYFQWHRYWKRKIAAKAIQEIIDASTVNFSVVPGGELTDADDDSAIVVCRFLYSLLVGAGLNEAYEWTEEKLSVRLVEDISAEMDKRSLLDTGHLFARYPIRRNANINGKNVVHSPSFSQRNGSLTIMEYIDLGASQINKAKERAGWMAYMFRDIKDYELDTQAISLIRPEGENHSDQIDFARQALSSGSRIVNWLDDNEKGAFLEERKRIGDPGLTAGG